MRKVVFTVIAAVSLAGNAHSDPQCPGVNYLYAPTTPYSTNNPNWHPMSFTLISYPQTGASFQLLWRVVGLQFTQGQSGSYVDFRICTENPTTGCVTTINQGRLTYQTGYATMWLRGDYADPNGFGVNLGVEVRTDSANTTITLTPTQSNPIPSMENDFGISCFPAGAKKTGTPFSK